MFSIKTCSKLNSKKKEEKNGFTFKVKKIKYERDREREVERSKLLGVDNEDFGEIFDA